MHRLTSLAVGSLLFVSAATFGQTETPPPPPPAADVTPPVPPPPPPLAADEPVAAAPVSVSDPGMRLRFGASAGFGTFFPGPMVNFGLEGRVGWQFTNVLGAYLVVGRNQGLWFGGTIVAGGGVGGASINVGFVGLTYVGAEAEAILGNHFFIALGPQIANGGWGYVGQSAMGGGGSAGATQEAGVVSGWMPGFGTKIGVGFGKPNPVTGRRTGFSMMLSTSIVYGGNGVRAAQSGGGGSGGAGVSQVVAPYGGIAIAPMLLFGFESR